MSTTSNHQDFIDSLNTFSEDQVQQAGARYTPGVDPDAPNLHVEAIDSAMANIACGKEACSRFEDFLSEFEKEWNLVGQGGPSAEKISSTLLRAKNELPSLMLRFIAGDAKAANVWGSLLTDLHEPLEAERSELRKAEARISSHQKNSHHVPELDQLRSKIFSFGRCIGMVNGEREYSESPNFKLLFDPVLLISGEWGTGKTHLMCDLTRIRVRQNRPTLLVLAKSFQGNVLKQICSCLAPDYKPSHLLDLLQKSALDTGERALIIVEGINEGPRREWRQAVNSLLKEVRARPSIGLVVTCRTPFEDIAIPNKERFHHLRHHGFEDQEFDAQAAFFAYYKLPLPEVPLLDTEFSRPLTLKLICEALRDLSGRKKEKGFAGIAAGQKGMTFVLESFVKRVGAPIEKEFGLNPNGCWWLLKGGGQIQDKALSGFAACMALRNRGYIRPSEADRVVTANYPAMSRGRRRALIEAMRTQGLLEEDIIWFLSGGRSKSRIVLRLPYQRFSDHLIARHLLEEYLDTSSEKAIRASFRASTPLGRIFKIGKSSRWSFSEPGLAQALIVEFPERVRKKIPAERQELIFALKNPEMVLDVYFEPFLEGFFWRDPTCFTEGTRKVINAYLSSGGSNWEKLIDALVAVSTKDKHPYNAQRLYKYIAAYKMPERDLTWSEFVRKRYMSPSVARLLAWVEVMDEAILSVDTSRQLVCLLSLLLTSVDRDARDLATKALVILGERYPEVLFDHVKTTLDFNDPYVVERMLAAAYGVSMSSIDSSRAREFRPILGGLAAFLYQNMFASGAKKGTHHTLIRGHAIDIIKLAIKARCFRLKRGTKGFISPPFPHIPFALTGSCLTNQHVQESIKGVIQMDFGNYTIGRLIPGRSNYDDNHPEYISVRAHIERRIMDLGYTEEKFQTIDRDIGNENYRGRQERGKVDRYGKKYSWIAYFEMWGEREAKGLLDEDRLKERTSDCGADPSFPKTPPSWEPPIPDLFGEETDDAASWVGGGYTPSWDVLTEVPEINGQAGPWVLLTGYVTGVNQARDLDIFALLDGLFIAEDDVDRLRSKFLSADYPGNSAIPDELQEYYLYAGEAGRNTRFAHSLLDRSGTYKQQLGEAFVEYVASKSKKKIAPVGIKTASADGAAPFKLTWNFLPGSFRTRRVPGVKVELPAVSFSWESYHSGLNQFSNFFLPAPSLIQRLGLASRDRKVDFFDSNGIPGTLYRSAQADNGQERHKLLYIRADLLRSYLTQTRQVLAWCIWGERDWYAKMDGFELRQNSDRSRLLQAYQHIHKYFSAWKG